MKLSEIIQKFLVQMPGFQKIIKFFQNMVHPYNQNIDIDTSQKSHLDLFSFICTHFMYAFGF